MSKMSVLIVGASIAGPTAAYWFARAGARVTVIERFPALRTGGQSVDIRTAGVTVMRRTPGMEAAVCAKTTEIEGISFVRNDGRPYGTIRATGNADEQSLVSEYEIFRGDLAQILFSLTKDNENVKYVFGEQVVAIQHNEKNKGPVRVQFANGLPASDFDLVVACDGATSRTRALGFGCDVRDYIEPTNCWAAYFSVKKDLLDGSKVGEAYSAVKGRFLALGPDPSGGTRVSIMGIHPRNDHSALESFREALKQKNDALKTLIAQQYKDAGWKADQILKGMMEADDFYATEMVQVKTSKLYKGRFVLLGDAGYAPGPSGGGTSLALAGAYILAGEIGRSENNIDAGLKAYEERMKPLTNDLQSIPPLVPTVLAPQTAWALWLRNNVFAFIAWTKILEYAQKHFANGFANSDKYSIPDYEWKA